MAIVQEIIEAINNKELVAIPVSYAQKFFDALDDSGNYQMEMKCIVTNGKLIIGLPDASA